MRETQSKLVRFCFRLTGQMAVAEELAQDTYVRAFQHPEKIPGEDGLYAWLYTIARHLFIDRTRTAEHKLEQKQVWNDPGEEGEAELIERLPDASARELEAVVMLRDALHRLSTEDRVVLVLIDFEDYSYEEASQVIGVSAAAVRSRLARARARFTELLNKVKAGDES